MENTDVVEVDTVLSSNASKSFTFSKPSVVPSSSRVITFGAGSEHVFDICSKKNVFTFAEPTTIVQLDKEDGSFSKGKHLDSRYKPKISRHLFKPAANMFAQALKDTSAFEQLKKNSRSQVAKINPENSITCSNVPKSLLSKKAAKEYFMSYGNILKIAIRPKKQVIVVFYASKEEANVAYHKSGEYLNETFNVGWTKAILPKSPTKKKDTQKNVVLNLLKGAVDEEVKSELEALAHLDYGTHKDGKEPERVIAAKKSRTLQKKTAGKQDKSLKPEKAVAKVEKLEPESQIIIPPLPTASIEELQGVIQQAALTSEEKYRVLEARDRLMRLKQVKLHTLATAKTTSGTCPDMCPEKERLMRESQRQVAPYELLEGNEYRINHMTAIKQYSRSSADQEEPMSHELRPVKSLKMTMSYLLHEIVDLCEQEGTNLGEWYHFLWDRTRGIRKDITQQELCCVDSVELVEQCARFHVVCSERLCAEDPSIFDKKINSENLTKCLQSLKYMYHDLRVKGIVCQNEPEFRAYIILLNLNNGNFMWEFQQLPESIQKSPEVKFALKVYFSLQSNDYYKFFKLVRETTYLNACILLRYFNQVRVKALSVMVKAYCRTTSTAYPLYELIDILGFEDESEAIYFCERVGLNVSNDEMYILLSRQNFSMPVSNIEQGRAYNMIEAKRTTAKLSIGECIAGGKMPEKSYKNHKPHNSFDSQGYLMPESINAEDQNLSGVKRDNTKNDLYKFMDKEESKPDKITWSHEKESIDHTQSKKQVNELIRQTTVSKPVTASRPNANVFAMEKSESNLSFVRNSVSQSIDKPPTSTPLKASTEKPLENTTSIFGTSNYTPSTAAKTESSAVFGSALKTTSIFSKPSDKYGKRSETDPNIITVSSPYPMAASKSIFSVSSGSIFAKQTTPSTVSGAKHPTVQDYAQQKTAVIDEKPRVSQSLPVSKESAQKESEKAKAYRLDETKKGKQLEEDANRVLNELQDEVLHEYCSSIARDEIERIRTYKMLSEKIMNEMTEEIIGDTCDVILTEELARQRQLNEMLLRIKHRTILKCFNIWKQYASKRKQQRQALDATPVWLQKCSVEECARSLYRPEQNIVIKSMCRRYHEEESERPRTNAVAPIEFIAYVGFKENVKSLDLEDLPNLFWKLIISWPDLENRTALWRYRKVMNQYLCPDDYTAEPIIKTYRPNEHEVVHVCIRYFEGLISDHNLIGADGILFIADAMEDLKCISRRLTKTVTSRQKLMPIPVIFLVLGEGDIKTLNEKVVLDLETLLESGYISEYTVAFETTLTEKMVLNLTQSTILWLIANKSPPNPLEMDYLANVFDMCLTEELWLRILGDATFNKKLSHALKTANFVIDLHNEAVNHLVDIILDSESLSYTKFAPEFKNFLDHRHAMPCSYEYFDDRWRSDDYRAELESAMETFVLPHWNFPWPIMDVHVLRQSIINYCREVLADSNYETIYCDILSNIFLMSGDLQVSNFVEILLYIVKEKIRLLDGNLKVVYNNNHIKHFRTLAWWFKSSTLTEFPFEEEANENNEKETDEPTKKRRKLLYNKSIYDHDATWNEFDSLAEFCNSTRNQIIQVQSASQEIENRLKVQRLQTQLLQEKLENALYDDIDVTSEKM